MHLHLEFARLRVPLLPLLTILCCIALTGLGAEDDPSAILLRDFKPRVLHRVPVTTVERARYPIIDVHSHAYARTPEQIDRWVRTKDEVDIERTIILTGATGQRFDTLHAEYMRYPDRFELWCGLDLSGSETPGFAAAVISELERCVQAGARGIGELSDKGQGLRFGGGIARGLHLDDARLDPVLARAGALQLPINIHVADPIWMYEPMDATNDGMMNALRWRLDNQPDIVGHSGMIDILERAVRKHPGTTFIACHFANLSYDLARLGRLLDDYPNLHADISARYAETAVIPRFTRAFYVQYQDRLLYGTDMGSSVAMYRTTFRILETEDEHFYDHSLFSYHWSLNGIGLPDAVLKKLYRDNAMRILQQQAP
jgi:uncharacterized protein